ncbi:MAG: hypothetical protein JNJ43_18795, partial [Anaerolineales bacterium]|nr:hypothetical protein [Anaerolineales bacterium]
SAGGWIYEQTQSGNSVEIWTIMCGFPPTKELSPFAQALHQQWGMNSAEEVVSGRRLEDVNSANLLGATVQHFDFLDCIYRQNKNGEWLYAQIFREPRADEDELPKQIADEISKRLVRRAAELLGKPLLYVADIPYLFNSPEQLSLHTVGMKENVEAVSETGIHVWVEAVAAYESQIPMLFESPEAMRNQMREYCLKNNGLRFWSR